MQFKPLAPDGPVLMIPAIHGDARGYFMETFRQNEFERHCGHYDFVQDNQSSSSGPVLRGLHYQLRHPQGKLVRVIHGKVFDVGVDLRKSSPTFGQAFGVILDDQKRHAFWVPPGFAHGFLVLSESAEFTYKCTDYYAPDDEHCMRWDDPALRISWPLPAGASPLLSAKDQQGLPFAQTPLFA